MKPKVNTKIANLILAFAASLAAVGSVVQVDPAVDIKHEVFGPSNVEAGSLVLLSVQGTDVKWEVFPEVPVETYGDNNAFLATAFQNPGDYLVVCAFKDTDGNVRIEKQLIHSGTDEPIAEPETEPEPEIVIVLEPVVEPEPDPLPNTKYPEVASEIANVADKSQLDPETAEILAANFLAVAERIADGAYETPAEILRDTAALNRPVIKVGAVTTKIQLIISKNRFDNEVVDMDDYHDLWTQISEGLYRYATN